MNASRPDIGELHTQNLPHLAQTPRPAVHMMHRFAHAVARMNRWYGRKTTYTLHDLSARARTGRF